MKTFFKAQIANTNWLITPSTLWNWSALWRTIFTKTSTTSTAKGKMLLMLFETIFVQVLFTSDVYGQVVRIPFHKHHNANYKIKVNSYLKQPHNYHDPRVRHPIRRCDLISDPTANHFGRFGSNVCHCFRQVINAVQHSLCSILWTMRRDWFL